VYNLILKIGKHHPTTTPHWTLDYVTSPRLTSVGFDEKLVWLKQPVVEALLWKQYTSTLTFTYIPSYPATAAAKACFSCLESS